MIYGYACLKYRAGKQGLEASLHGQGGPDTVI